MSSEESAVQPDDVVSLESSKQDPAEDSRISSLRWWPAALLLLAMLALRLVLVTSESPSMAVMMLGFLGPAFAGILILFWWCFASRAPVKEKLLGFLGFILIAAVAFALIHFSMIGFGLAIMVFPTGIALFAIGLMLLARNPRLRVPVALLLAALGFGYWDLVQSEGMTGDFKPQLLWRWEPTAEETYLASLVSRESSDPIKTDSRPITRASSPWPEFRGAQRNGIVRGVVLEEDWTASPPQEKWRTRIGPGWSSFSVASERLFTQEQRGEQEVVLCLDAESGTIVWEYAYPSRFWEAIGGPGPRATPTIADEGLFALGADGILVCLDAVNGTEIWKRDLKADANRKPPIWGFSSSPLVTHSLVIVHAGGEGDKGVLAYRTDTGEIAWSAASGDHTYSSPQMATFDTVTGVLMVSNDGLQFLSISGGETIWEHEWAVQQYRVLQPLVLGSSILLSSSPTEGARKITVSPGEDEAWSITEAWTSSAMKPEFSDYVSYEDHYYGFDGGLFACFDVATGSRQWKRGRYGSGQAILLADSGQLLIASEKGELVLVRANPDKLNEIATIKAIEGKTWNHPVLVGNRVYIRNAVEAACFELPLAATE